ncbi:MAG: hypothetical protein FJ150_02590 [Euryarchaeota archaeon]|nr:hypothetical protein [Euryarchaeota archaeon]
MRNKDKFNLGLVVLVLIVLALGFGFYANPLGSGNINFGWDNSTIQSDGNTELQSTGDGGSQGRSDSQNGGDQPPDDSPETYDCPDCVNGYRLYAFTSQCPVCHGDGWIGQRYIGERCKVCDGDGRIDPGDPLPELPEREPDCPNCGRDGVLNPGDPGYPD